MVKILVFSVCDYLALPNGGEVMLLNNFFAANKSTNLQYYLVGMTFNSSDCIGEWTEIKIGDNTYRFFPVTKVTVEKERTHIPFRLRVTLGIKKFWKEINEVQADYHYIHSAELAIPMWKKENINIVYHMHGDPCQTLHISRFPIFRMPVFSVFYWKIIERAVRKSNKIIWAANRAQKLYLEQQPHMRREVESKSITIHSSFDTKFKVNYDDFPKLHNRKHLITVGRLSRVKRNDFIIRVVAKLVHDCMDVDLIVCGDGEERGSLLTLAKQLGIEERVIFLGLTNREMTATALDASEVFLFASENEAMSLVVLESLYMGTPVVSTNVGDIPDVVLDGVSGYIVNDYNIDLYASKVKTILEKGRNNYSDTCKKIASKYTPNKMAGAINAVFNGDVREGV